MTFNPASIILGAVNGALQEVIPPVARDVAKTINQASDQPAALPPPPPPATLDPDAIAAKVAEIVMQQPAVAKLATPVPWYQSQAIWGGIVATAAPVLGLLGYALSPEDVQAAATALVAIASGIGGVLAIYGRLTTTRPIKGA